MTINPIPASGGTNYVVGDIVTISTGTGGKAIVESTTSSGSITGIVTSVSLISTGSAGYTAITSYATGSGSGTGLYIQVLTVGTIGRITTSYNHPFKIGDSISLNGATDTGWTSTFTILGVDSLTTFDIGPIIPAATAVVAFSNGVTTLVDSSASWDINEHTGKIVCITTSGTAPTSQIMRITSNTATTLTIPTITQAVTGSSRYIIYDPSMIGRDEQFKFRPELKGNFGWATSGGTTTLTDSTKNWNSNQWYNYKLRIISGTGYVNNEIVISGNTATSLYYVTQTFVPDTTTKYLIMDTFGISQGTGSQTTLSDLNKNWTTNQFAGKRIRFTGGTGLGQESLISSNTSNTLTFGSVTTGPTGTTTYTILGIPARGAGIQLMHLYGTSNIDIKGKYIWYPRGGGSNTFDRLDISREVWEYGYFFSPQFETFTTGSMYSYDGNDTIYLQKDATGRVYSYDIRSNKISNASTIPYGHSTAAIGNRMEIISTSDGLKYMYMMRHTGQEMFRNLLWW